MLIFPAFPLRINIELRKKRVLCLLQIPCPKALPFGPFFVCAQLCLRLLFFSLATDNTFNHERAYEP